MKKFMLICLSTLTLLSCKEENKMHPYPQENVDAFIQGCKQSSGGEEKICNCMIDKIREKVTFDDFVKLEERLKTQPNPEDLSMIFNIASECAKK